MIDFYSFLTGKKYRKKDLYSSSRNQIILFGNCLLIPVMLWFFIGFLSVQNLFGGGWFAGMVTGIILAFLILLVERAILLTDKGFWVTGFRLVLGVCVALIGAILLENVVFQNDIENKITEYQINFVDESIARARLNHQNRLDELATRYQEDHSRFLKADQAAIDEFYGLGPSKTDGNGPYYRFLRNRANVLKETRDGTKVELDGLRNKVGEDLREAESIALAQFNGDGLLMKIKALHDLVISDRIMLGVFIVFFVFFFALEFVVVVVKLNSKKSLSEIIDELMEKQKEDQIREAYERYIRSLRQEGLIASDFKPLSSDEYSGILTRN